MENYKGGLKGYWKRREYQRLDGAARRRRTTHKAELGDGRRRRPFWRIRIPPRLRVLRRLAASPKRILARIRDAYVRMMLGFAGSGALSAGYGYGAREAVGFGRPQLKEYDEKMLVEIYKSIVAQGHPFAAAAAGGAPAAVAVGGVHAG